MFSSTIRICPEGPGHDKTIEALNLDAFGPGRFTRTAYRLRERAQAEPRLSFVALIEGSGANGVVGSVRQTRIRIGSRQALLLGPLVVDPGYKNIGIGRELMNRTLTAARQGGYHCIVLVGDLPYYSRFGFSQFRPAQIAMPGPVDPRRLLGLALNEADLADYAGMAVADAAKKQHSPINEPTP